MRYYYCPKCGNKLIDKQAGDDGNVPYCNICQKYWFDSFTTCVIVLVCNELNEIALLRQSYLSDKYDVFVSGYIKAGESAEETAIREVKEELGIDIERLEFTKTVWFDKGHSLMLGFIAYANKQEFILSNEVDSARWVKDIDVHKTLFPDCEGNAAFATYKEYLKKKNNNH